MVGKFDNYEVIKMALAKPKFEDGSGEDMGGDDTAVLSGTDRLKAAAAAREAEQKAAEKKPADVKQSTSKDVATTTAGSGNQVAKAAAPMVDPLTSLQDVFPVEFDTLCNIQLNQGNAINKDTEAVLGDVIGLELLSHQDQTVVSPGVDDKEAKEFVRYSDDGITTTKGENVQEYLAELKNGPYPNAKTSKRVVIVGSLFDAGSKGNKIPGMKDTLVQINLAPSSVSELKRYRAGQAFKIGKGLAQVAGVERLRITCQVKKNGDNSYTVGVFTRYDDPTE